MLFYVFCFFFFFKQKTAYEMRISDWSSDVCSSDLSRNSPCRIPRPQPSVSSSRPSCRLVAARYSGISRVGMKRSVGGAVSRDLSHRRRSPTDLHRDCDALLAEVAARQDQLGTWDHAWSVRGVRFRMSDSQLRPTPHVLLVLVRKSLVSGKS